MKTNGMSNKYRGWGAEDDDLFYRLRANDLVDTVSGEPFRTPVGKGIFSSIDESEDSHPVHSDDGAYARNLEVLASMSRFSDKWKWDGLSNTCYKETAEKTVTVKGKVYIYHVKVTECGEEEKDDSCPNEKEESIEAGVEALETYVEKHPRASHSWYNLAKAYEYMDKLDKAKQAYRKRIQITGGNEWEFRASQVQLGQLALSTNDSDGAVVSDFLAIFELVGNRSLKEQAVPLYNLAKYFRDKGQNRKAFVFASAGVGIVSEEIGAPSFLSVDRDYFLFQMLDELCISAFYAGQMSQGRGACQSILQLVEQQRVDLDTSTVDRIKQNLQFYQ